MTPFLQQIAKAYASNYEGDLRECLFVFPSRRSSLFFQKYLGLGASRPLFAPGITTIGELVSTLSPYRKGDRVELLYILYQKYSQVLDKAGEAHASFDDFVGWGEALLSDFNDVDKYLVDASRLFANISDLHQLDSGYDFLNEAQKEALRHFWGVVVEGESEGSKKEFRHTWSFLSQIYSLFTAELRERHIAYDGLMIHDLALCIKEGRAEFVAGNLPGVKRIVVVGQNALCEAEKVLLDYIKSDWDGDFYWDYEGEWLQDPGNKASHFIKDYISRYPSKYALEKEQLGKPDIDVVSVSSGVAQAKVAAGYLEKYGQDDTVVVLPDENMLMPLLHSIPEKVKDVNVTMGYGLAGSTVAALMHHLSSLQVNKILKEGKWMFHHSDVKAIVSLPFGVFADVQKEIDAVLADMVKRNKLYLGQEEFFSPLLRLLFSPLETAEEIQRWQMDVIEALAPGLGYVEREFAYGYYTAISRIRDLHIPMKPSTYFRFVSEMASRVKASFKGEPLAGLQVMGPLEVRALDFENIIMLSVDEGVFPAKAREDSFIPYNLRRAFGLPTAELFDSISSYHFYRSICRAKNVVLIYDSRTKALMSGEESRFIKQLRYDYRHNVNVIDTELKIEPVDCTPEVVEKTPEILKKLDAKFINPAPGCKPGKFSASTLMDYIACPLMFYYKHVEELKEEEKVNEDVDAGMFGTAYHKTMQDFYSQFKGQVVPKELLAEKLKSKDFGEELEKMVLGNMASELKVEVDALTGRNRITASLVQALVEITLKRDSQMSCDAGGFEYVDSERYMAMDLKVPVGGEEKTVVLHGYVDRLDAPFQTQYRICDYKTGYVQEVNHYDGSDNEAALEKIFSGEAKTSFQLLVYALLLKNDIKRGKLAEREDIALAVYDVKKQFREMKEGKLCDASLLEAFEESLRGLVAEIFSPEIPFGGRPGKPCKYCPAALICNR